MEFVTFGIAIAGFFMSLTTWIREFWMRRNRIEVSVLDYSWPLGTVHLFVLLQNKSTLPASVAKISVKLDGKWFDCELDPKKIKEIPGAGLITSPLFPLAVPPQSFLSAYLEFLNAPDMQLSPGKKIAFQVHTSRGIVTRSATLGNKGHYLNKRS